MRGHSRSVPALVLVVAICACGTRASAVTVDGRAEAEYGPPLSVQTTSTSLGDMPPEAMPADSLNFSWGSELDQAFGFVDGAVLRLVLAGNLGSYEGETHITPDQLQVFVDCIPGGQHTLRADNPDLGTYYGELSDLAGLTFDDGFEADYFFEAIQMGVSTDALATFYAELPASGGGTGYKLGDGTGGGTGTLTGGTNPFGVLASIDQRNRAGVVYGCDAGSGAGVVSGTEWAIPLAAIGNPTGPIRVCALVGRSQYVSNQVLGPVPPGTCTMTASAIDYASIPGTQYFTIDIAVPARPSTWGRLKSLYRD